MSNTSLKSEAEPAQDWLQIVREKVDGLVSGEVLITIHDYRVTQIERREKVQFQLTKQEKKPH
jgi:hypothetical protein